MGFFGIFSPIVTPRFIKIVVTFVSEETNPNWGRKYVAVGVDKIVRTVSGALIHSKQCFDIQFTIVISLIRVTDYTPISFFETMSYWPFFGFIYINLTSLNTVINNDSKLIFFHKNVFKSSNSLFLAFKNNKRVTIHLHFLKANWCFNNPIALVFFAS